MFTSCCILGLGFGAIFATLFWCRHAKQDSQENSGDALRSTRRYFDLKPYIADSLSAEDQGLMLNEAENAMLEYLLPKIEDIDVITVALQSEEVICLIAEICWIRFLRAFQGRETCLSCRERGGR